MINRIKDFPPSETNSRNSEGAFVTLKDGSILFVYTRYNTTSQHDHAPADLYGAISTDNGNTFGEPFPVVLCKDIDKAENIMSVSLARLNNGDIGLFFARKSFHSTRKFIYNCQPCFLRSTDEGKTWYDFQVIDEDEEYLILCNDKVLVRKDGVINFIVSELEVHAKENGNGYEVMNYFPGKIKVYESADNGKTWNVCGKIDNIVNYAFGALEPTGLVEPGVIEKQDGTLYSYFRTCLGYQFESVSTDRGQTWSEAHPSRFSSPHAPMTMKRLSNGDIIAVWNPTPVYNGRSQKFDGVWHGGRTLLVYAISKDDGKTWLEMKEIENDETGGFCYPAIHETNDAILLGYCAGGVEDRGGCLTRLRISKILKSDL